MTNKALGGFGESYVCGLLAKRGYRILCRNFRDRFFEIDIIALKDDTINFIEVKTREGFEMEEQYKAINRFKVAKIKRGIRKFIAQNDCFSNFSYKILGAIVLINPYAKSAKVVIYDCLN